MALLERGKKYPTCQIAACQLPEVRIKVGRPRDRKQEDGCLRPYGVMPLEN
jgi:hypothetical protein